MRTLHMVTRFFTLGLSILMLASFNLQAQQPGQGIKQVFVVSGDVWGDPQSKVRVGAYYPQSGKFKYLDSVSYDYTSVAGMEGPFLYYSADTFLYKFNLNTLERIDSVGIPGLRDMSLHANKIMVSREWPATQGYFQYYDQGNLTLLYSDTVVEDECAGITHLTDTFFVASPGGFGNPPDSGTIAVYNTAENSYIRSLKLDTNLRTVQQLYNDGRYLYAIGNYWAGETDLGVYDRVMDTFVRYPVAVTDGVALAGNKLYLYTEDGLTYFNTQTRSLYAGAPITTTEMVNGAFDPLHEIFFLTHSDYASWGTLTMRTASGVLMDSVNVGIAPEGLVVDYQNGIMAETDSAGTKAAQPVNIALLANDREKNAPPFTLSITSGPYNGNIELLTADTVEYTPNEGFVGTDVFNYEVCDNLFPQQCSETEVIVTVEPATGVYEKQVHSLRCYPNPATNHVTLTWGPQLKPTRAEMMDVTGRVARHIQTDGQDRQSRININDLEPGMYLIKLYAEDGEVRHSRFIKH